MGKGRLCIPFEACKMLDSVIAYERVIKAWCGTCGYARVIPLDEWRELRAKAGTNLRIAGRRHPCRTEGCAGMVRHQFEHGGFYWPLWDDDDYWRWLEEDRLVAAIE